MLNSNGIGLTDEDDLRGFARTIAEIEWLLLILVLAYLVAVKQQAESAAYPVGIIVESEPRRNHIKKHDFLAQPVCYPVSIYLAACFNDGCQKARG